MRVSSQRPGSTLIQPPLVLDQCSKSHKASTSYQDDVPIVHNTLGRGNLPNPPAVMRHDTSGTALPRPCQENDP